MFVYGIEVLEWVLGLFGGYVVILVLDVCWFVSVSCGIVVVLFDICVDNVMFLMDLVGGLIVLEVLVVVGDDFVVCLVVMVVFVYGEVVCVLGFSFVVFDFIVLLVELGFDLLMVV